MEHTKAPQSGPEWIARVNGSIRGVEAALRNARTVPVGGLVLYAGGGTAPPGWLTANGAAFSGTTYPLLKARLGSTTLPAPAAVSGIGWIIRAV